MSKVMKISIIGSGVVGTLIGTGFEKLGYEVVFYDVNSKRVEELKKRHKATTDLEYAIKNTSASFVCVPTPYTTGFDSSHLISVAEGVVKTLKDKDDYHLLVIKSTVVPTTTENIIIPILEKYKKVGGI